MSKHIVTYIGHGVWKDAKGDMWAKKHENPDILAVREYNTLDDRDDLRFMISYGAMSVHVVETESKNEQEPKEIKEAISQTAVVSVEADVKTDDVDIKVGDPVGIEIPVDIKVGDDTVVIPKDIRVGEPKKNSFTPLKK